MMGNPNMKFKDICDHFWAIYGKATPEEVKDNRYRLTTDWQPHQGFEALVAQIEVCLVYGHFAKKSIPDDDLIDAFIIVGKHATHRRPLHESRVMQHVSIYVVTGNPKNIRGRHDGKSQHEVQGHV